MIYYFRDNIMIRDMIHSDAQIITEGEIAQGWNQTIDKYKMRLQDQAEGKSIALIAEYNGAVAGYINVYPDSQWGAFAGQGYPEIVDFGVLEKYRRHGIGTKLMDIAEQVAARYADTVYLGVGLHSGYGSAQRMYVKRGYVPDGSGAWYQGRPCMQYETVCTVDDDLMMFLSKKLSGTKLSRDADRPENPRRATVEEAETAAALACELWLDHTQEEMAQEFRLLLSKDDAAVFLYMGNGKPVGFAQCQLRHDYVEGTETSPVGYLEGVYVKETNRRQGIARELVSACEKWAREQGCTEFASDCELTNTESQAFHQAIGFKETNRIVAYVRKI